MFHTHNTHKHYSKKHIYPWSTGPVQWSRSQDTLMYSNILQGSSDSAVQHPSLPVTSHC